MRDVLEDFLRFHRGEFLPDVDPGGEGGFVVEGLVALLAADEEDGGAVGSLTGVPQVADEFEALAAELLGFVEGQDVGAAGEGVFEEGVELAGVSGCLAVEVEEVEQFQTDVTRGGPGAELQEQHQVRGHFLQGGQDGEGLAQAGVAVDAGHGAGVDGVGDVLPGLQEGLGGDDAGVGQVEVEVGLGSACVGGHGRSLTAGAGVGLRAAAGVGHGCSFG